MKVTAERLDKTRAQVTVEISEEEFEPSLQKAYRIVVKKVQIPGFRKGKAPRRILENMYGREILLEDAINDAIPTAYAKALEEIKDEYVAVGQPEYDIVQVEKDEPVIFKAAFDIKPEVVLGQYKGLELKKEKVDVTKEHVDKEISLMQQRYAKLEVVEGPAQEGDIVSIDFEGRIGEEAFQGGKGEDYSLELGSNTFIPGFEEQVVGMAKDETKDIKVMFPEDYQAEELAGKEAVFTVTIKEIKRKELTELDDEFAKDVSEFATMQELRDDIENKLKEAAEKKAEEALKESAVKLAAESAEIDVPQSMIESRIDTLVGNFAQEIQRQGIPFEYYLEVTKNTLEGIRDGYRPNAEASVRSDLVLEAIAKEEKIEVTPEDVDEEIEKIAKQVNQEKEKVREIMEKQGQISSIEFGIMMTKAVDLIIAEAKVE